MRGDRKFGSNAIRKLKKKPHDLLVTILIGNNLVNIFATVVATFWGINAFGDNAIGIVTGVLTFVILVFGEITPKTFAQKFAESYSRLIAYPLLLLTYILFPIIWLFDKFIQGLMKLLNVEHPIHTTSEEELLAMVDIGREEGVFEEGEQELIENVLEFSETTVEEIMTIERDIKAIENKTPIKEMVHYFVEHGHSRIPIYKEDINNIVGIMNVHDILRLLHEGLEEQSVEKIQYNPVIVVPKTKSIHQLFKEFQNRRQHIAIVVDERGETIGLVTMEDILEEIVGDIVDEHDKEEKTIFPVGKNEWEMSAETSIEDINEALDIELSYPEHQTIGLLILETLNRFPKQGEKIEYEGLEIQVKVMGKKKIETVVITKLNKHKNN